MIFYFTRQEDKNKSDSDDFMGRGPPRKFICLNNRDTQQTSKRNGIEESMCAQVLRIPTGSLKCYEI